MIVISDTSPLINLAVIDRLELLNQLYGKIFIPNAVYYEVAVKGTGKPGSVEIEKLQWIEVKSASNRGLFQALRLELDEGESEAIALAVELNAELLLLDERLARSIAGRLGLQYIGLIGIIIEAK